MPDSAHRHYEIVAASEPGAVVVEIPHAGVAIDPRSARYTHVPEAALAAGALLADSDVGADRMWEGSEGWGVTRIVARTSRYVIDLNTEPRFPTPYQNKLPPGLREILHRSECGVRWRTEPPPQAELERRVTEIFQPYHHAVARLLELARERHGHALLLSAHTFPNRSCSADLVIGTRHGESAGEGVRAALADAAAAHGLSVALEEPFRGGYSVATHARRSDGVAALQLEVARRLICHAAPRTPTIFDEEGVARMANIMKHLQATARAWLSATSAGR